MGFKFSGAGVHAVINGGDAEGFTELTNGRFPHPHRRSNHRIRKAHPLCSAEESKD